MPTVYPPADEGGQAAGPLQGRIARIHRMPGHYVGEREPIVDIEVGIHRITLCAPFDGKVMRCREVGFIVQADERVTELTGVGTPTWELFVAYRRSDAPGHAHRVGDGLITYFGKGQVFKDIESLPYGVDFVDFIREKLQRAFVMVVVIGPEWAKDPRLQDPEDLHREEIRTALERGLHVVPVLVNGATMPRKDELPEDIRPLHRKNAVEMTDKRWDYDANVLVRTVEGFLAESPRRKRFLAHVPPWDWDKGWQWIADDPHPNDEPFDYEAFMRQRRDASGQQLQKVTPVENDSHNRGEKPD